ncbi:unnamed protein product [Brassica napus]|uniref:(rape) hypothetical protein n=1 Tax=Brassica napus TaxID=3708 RepID=A0A816J577_BRANA|nr:unnamed protein product [Brassica napus]
MAESYERCKDVLRCKNRWTRTTSCGKRAPYIKGEWRIWDCYCEGAGSQNPNVNGNCVWNPGVLVVEEDKSYSSVIAEKLWIAEYRRISVLDEPVKSFTLLVEVVLKSEPVRGTCTTAPSDPPEEIVHRARYLLSGNGFGEYHLLDNNCEDFAIYCKTGLLVFSVTKSGSSSQVNSVCAAGGVASLALRFLGVGRTAGQAASLVVCPASVVSAAASAISTTLGIFAKSLWKSCLHLWLF